MTPFQIGIVLVLLGALASVGATALPDPQENFAIVGALLIAFVGYAFISYRQPASDGN